MPEVSAWPFHRDAELREQQQQQVQPGQREPAFHPEQPWEPSALQEQYEVPVKRER